MYLSRNHGENRDAEFEVYSTRISKGPKKNQINICIVSIYSVKNKKK